LATRKNRWQRTVIGCAMAVGLAGCIDDPFMSYDCSVIPPAATSPYILPWMIGTTHRVIPHAARDMGPQKYAIDAAMPIGTPILAIRDGLVVRVEESFVDGDNVYLHENYIFVEHDDGTVARYVHLTNGGAVFGVGDRVRQAEIVGYSGHTGNSSGPHLHLDVTRSCCASTVDTDWAALPAGETLPINFRNATTVPPRKPDLSCGLLPGVDYTAEPY
jgi:murein DD-endopeptidase MepM/ murein hydrolase activator NlpD